MPRHSGPNLGSGKRPPFFRDGAPLFRKWGQAEATLQWDRFLAETACPSGQQPLRLNLDESSVKLWPGARKGVLADKSRAWRRLRFETGVSLRAQRGALSFVAVVADDPKVQGSLPQFLVGNSRLVTERDAARFTAGRTDTIVLLRRRSSWLDASAMIRVVGTLGAAVAAAAPGRFVILSMDAAPVHLSPPVLRAIARAGMHFMPIASLMTRWLQPCDVSVFRAFKHRIRLLYEQRQLLQDRSELDVFNVMDIAATAAREIIQGRSWKTAFELCGLAAAPPTSKRFREAMEGAGELTFSAETPTMEHLQALFPRGRMIPVENLFPLLLRPGERPRRSSPDRERPTPPPEPGAGAGAPRRDLPWFGRTRSTSSLPDAPAPAAAASSSSSPPTAAPPPATRPRVPVGTYLGPWLPLPRPRAPP